MCVWVSVCCGWAAELSSTFLKNLGASVSRYSFVYWGAKTTQRAVPAKTCQTGREDEGAVSQERDPEAVS